MVLWRIFLLSERLRLAQINQRKAQLGAGILAVNSLIFDSFFSVGYLGGVNSTIFLFSPLLGEGIPHLTSERTKRVETQPPTTVVMVLVGVGLSLVVGVFGGGSPRPSMMKESMALILR